ATVTALLPRGRRDPVTRRDSRESYRQLRISRNFHAFAIWLLRSAALVWGMSQKPHHSKSKPMKKCRTISFLIFAALCTNAYATPKTVIISLDGATPRIVDQLNASGQLNANEGINLLRSKGFSARQNITIAHRGGAHRDCHRLDRGGH